MSDINNSRSLTDKAGKILAGHIKNGLSINESQNILNNWRVRHAYPINTFQSTLQTKLRSKKYGKEYIVAQRLKRSGTIIDKLKDFKTMDLTRMQDIAGVRAILPSMKDVRALEKEYTNNIKFLHTLKKPPKDYINTPKEHDGYRSLHLVYQYKNKQKPQYDGLFVELQIRTKLQHSWAMAVETMQRFMKKAIKTRNSYSGDSDWKNFFLLVSSAFSILEKTPVVSIHKNMTKEEIFNAVAKTAKDLKVIEKMKAFPVAINFINKKAQKSFYHLIILDMEKKVVQVKSFGRDEFKKAYMEYTKQESLSLNKPHIDSILVSATKGSLQKAYPSFFDESNDFIKNLNIVINKTTK